MHKPSVTLLSAAELPIGDDETPLLARTLETVGIEARIVAWTDRAALTDPGELAIIRSTWDYFPVVDGFLEALQQISVTVANPVEVVRWNSHKGYLLELAAAGLPVVPTTLVRRGGTATLDPAVPLVIKPAVSGGAIGVGRFDADDPAAATHLVALSATGDVLVQPFQPAIAEGETSLIYLGGAFSHAVRKVPATGGYLVQAHLGGALHPHEPTAAEFEVARAALAVVSVDLLYARVDLINGPDGPLLMEIELIEPYLFLIESPGSVERFAAVIADRLG